MYIKSIDLDRFRNYKRIHLDFTEGITIFYGDNAQGKTNVLEAILFSLTGKSHRSSKDKEMISFYEEESHIKVILDKNNDEHRIDVHIKQNKNKGIAINSIPVKRTRDFMGMFPCVLFSPEDLQLVKDGPSERRKFIDNELCQLDKIYLNYYMKYKKTLEQRNQLLKDAYFERSLYDTLDVWDEQLLLFGTEIIKIRKKFIEELNEIISNVHFHISGEKEKLTLIYEYDTDENEFREKLRNAREKDLKLKTTSVGPHRDDIKFDLNGIDARVYGSQGQKRSCALSLKMSEIELVKRKTGNNPVLLLDDVLSELDSGRQMFLLDSISGIQTIITCTGIEDFIRNRVKTDRVYHVTDGQVEDYKIEVK